MESANFIKRNLLFILISFIITIFSCSSVKSYEIGQEIPQEDYLTFTAGENGATNYIYAT